jgi:hypothetical protein
MVYPHGGCPERNNTFGKCRPPKAGIYPAKEALKSMDFCKPKVLTLATSHVSLGLRDVFWEGV